jgi:hypothetical protein
MYRKRKLIKKLHEKSNVLQQVVPSKGNKLILPEDA